MKPAKAGQPYSAAINHVIVGQVLHSPALNEGHVLVNPPYLELLGLKQATSHYLGKRREGNPNRRLRATT